MATEGPIALNATGFADLLKNLVYLKFAIRILCQGRLPSAPR
jgi:hypothetical protein